MKVNKKGFTILELLISVAIIAMLSAIILVGISSMRERSRDARRMSDVSEIQKALNLYFTNHNTFPVFPTEITITGDDLFSVALEGERLITAVPSDPIPTFGSYKYQSNSTGTDFYLNFCLETDTIPKYTKGCNNRVTP